MFSECHVPRPTTEPSTLIVKSWIGKGATWLPYQNDAAMVLNAARAAVPKLMEIGGRA